MTPSHPRALGMFVDAFVGAGEAGGGVGQQRETHAGGGRGAGSGSFSSRMLGFAPRLVTLAMALLWLSCANTPHPPEVTHLLTGREFPLDAFHGRVMLLNIWATWCKPCLIEVPELAKAADQYGEKVTFVALYYQLESTAGPKVTAWLRGEPDYFSHYVAWGNSSMHALYPHKVLPTTYVIGRAGAVVAKFEGSLTSEARLAELRAAIETGLQQPLTGPPMTSAPTPTSLSAVEQWPFPASEGL